MSGDDPLADADIGETVTVQNTEEVWIDRFEDPNARGSDRFRDSRITNVELVEDEYGDPSVAVTVESEVTKALPRRWDTARAPRTDSEQRQARRRRWRRRLARWLPVPVTLGIGLAITNRVMSQLRGEVVIGGEPLTYSPWDLVPVVAIVAVAFMAIQVWPFVARGAR